jgi:AraC family transcriptional regulator
LSRIERIACESGDVDDFSCLGVGVESGDRWSGVRVQAMFGRGQGALPESYLPGHLLTIGPCLSLSARWLDGPSLETAAECPSDTVCVFPAMQPYRSAWDSTGRIIFVELAPELVDGEPADSKTKGRKELRPGFAANDRFIPPLAEALLELATRDEAETRILAESLGLTLATYLGQKYSRTTVGTKERAGTIGPRKLRLVKAFIDARLDAPISLADLARQVGMSIFHFARCFRLTTGMPPYQFVTRRRIERARELLIDPNLSVSDVAVRCGFSQQSHFGEVFRRVVGASPRSYRASLGVAVSETGRFRADPR